MTYHLDWTVFLLAHTIAEVFDLVAFVLVFAAAVWQGRRGSPSRPRVEPLMHRVLPAALLAASLLGVAAGCGGSGDSAPVATTK